VKINRIKWFFGCIHKIIIKLTCNHEGYGIYYTLLDMECSRCGRVVDRDDFKD
jgi:hypothetical protein